MSQGHLEEKVLNIGAKVGREARGMQGRSGMVPLMGSRTQGHWRRDILPPSLASLRLGLMLCGLRGTFLISDPSAMCPAKGTASTASKYPILSMPGQ